LGKEEAEVVAEDLEELVVLEEAEVVVAEEEPCKCRQYLLLEPRTDKYSHY
jgi:hypothetical protein